MWRTIISNSKWLTVCRPISFIKTFTKANTAPAVDETLRPEDAGKILEELLEVQNSAHLFGLMINVKPCDVEAIQTTYQQPKDRLLHIILKFLNQEEPSPTWRVMVAALRTKTVNLPRLATKLEAAHFPDSTSTRDVVPETTGMSPSHLGLTGVAS